MWHALPKQQYVGNSHHSLVWEMRTWTSIPWLPPTIQQWLICQWYTWEQMSQENSMGHQRCSRPLWWEEMKWYETEGAKQYREANKRIQKALDRWVSVKRLKLNSNRAYQLEKDLTSEKQRRSSTIQDRSGKCVTVEQEILSRVVVIMQFWTAVSPQKKI